MRPETPTEFVIATLVVLAAGICAVLAKLSGMSYAATVALFSAIVIIYIYFGAPHLRRARPYTRPVTQQELDSSDRFLGLFALVGSGVLGYLYIVGPLVAASEHDRSVFLRLFRRSVVLIPVFFAIGIIYLFLGVRARPLLGRRQMPSPLGLVIYAGALGLGILLYQWMKTRMIAYGYG